jgi:hypothetical protein
MIIYADWIIEVWQTDCGKWRWVMWRYADKTKQPAQFDTFGALKRFCKSRCIGLGQGQKVRGYNRNTREYRDVVTA